MLGRLRSGALQLTKVDDWGTLGAKRLQAVGDLHANDFDLEVLTRVSESGSKETVVLMGETHINRASTQEAGVEAALAFDRIGYEAASAGPLLGSYLTVQLKRFKRALRAELDEEVAGSTIQRVVMDERMFPADGSPSLSHILGKDPAGDLVKLESGHKRTWDERLSRLSLRAPGDAVLGTAVGATLGITGVVSFPAAAGIAAASAVPYVGIKLARRLPSRLRGGFVLSNLTDPIPGLLHGRNRTMATRIGEALSARSDGEPILAMMGRAHVDGVAQELESIGFTRLNVVDGELRRLDQLSDN